MSNKWRVYNMHSQGMTHREKFKEQLIEIPAGKYVLMDYDDAVQFKSQYFPIKKNAQGAEDPACWKQLKLEPDGDAKVTQTEKFVCMFDGATFPNQSMLDAYIKQNHADKIVVDEAAEAEIEATRPRGRPRKEATA